MNFTQVVELDLDEKDPQHRRLVFRIWNPEMEVTPGGSVASTVKATLEQAKRFRDALDARIAQLEHGF